MSRFGNRQCLNCTKPLTSRQNLYCSRECCRSMLMKRRWIRKHYVSSCHEAPLDVWTDEDGNIKHRCTECGSTRCKRVRIYMPTKKKLERIMKASQLPEEKRSKVKV